MNTRPDRMLPALLPALAAIACLCGAASALESTAATVEGTSMAKAIFAGGCFWCMQPPFEKVTGVQNVVAGYIGGSGENPDYEDYAEGGYIEAIQVTYDPEKVSYDRLLDVFWRQINPTEAGGQFVDRGPQYRSAILYENDQEKRLAEKSKARLAASGRFHEPIVTEILKAGTFYPAEDYHQDYYKKDPIRYRHYRGGSGRDKFLDKVWGANRDKADPTASVTGFVKPSDEELRKKLTPTQYEVTQKAGTEPAFDNEYWNNEREGVYVDIVSGEPLFSSLDKYDSGTGWPSFAKPLEPGGIVESTDKARVEVRSKLADSHLGHVFDDGPPPTHLRYCLNSAALRFVPKEDLEREGYGRYMQLFEAAGPAKKQQRK